MQIVVFDQYRVGVIADAAVADVSGAVEERWRGTPYAINELIADWDAARPRVEELAAAAEKLPLSRVRLLPPVPRPRQLFAAPLNYHRHVDEMVDSKHAPDALRPEHSPSEIGFFVKATGSISGPEDPIQLPPMPGRAFHHEVELGVVIGSSARAVSPAEARSHIFGYLCLMDITLRTEGGFQEERTLRKSFESFTPIGPSIVTADEVPDPDSLRLRLWVNDEPRQDANTADLIVGVDDLISYASQVVTLHPGDVYATGTPEGVGPIVPGDRIKATVESVGTLDVPVEERRW